MTNWTCALESMTVENLRGFDKATLDLRRSNIVLVGPNNSGKTSLLRLLDWAINRADNELLRAQRRLDSHEHQLLMPARDARGMARRITMAVRISDGRTARRFQAVDSVAHLRLQFRAGGVFAALGPPRRSEPAESVDRAIDLLAALRRSLTVTYIGSSRDADSLSFDRALKHAIQYRLEAHLLPRTPGGTPRDYRTLSRGIASMKRIGSKEVDGLWDHLRERMPSGMAREARFDFDLSMESLIEWLTSRASMRISTGPHDQRMVLPEELGSGLQSILMMRLLESDRSEASKTLLLLEEPEAFLHPSAQRSLARALFDTQELRLVTTTHSTVVVDEAVAADVVLVRGHRVYAPRDANERRSQINSALLTGQGSEAIFARSVLLVEGPSDRAFFERLRRRLAEHVPPECLSRLGIVAVGGKARFAPWIQLLESYTDRHSGYRPIEYLVVADSVDAATDVARGTRDGGVTIPLEIDRLLKLISQGFSVDAPTGATATANFNLAAESAGVAIAFEEVDLEYTALSAASPTTVSAIADRIGLPVQERTLLMRRLGSKIGGAAPDGAKKDDWMRAEIAALLDWSEISDNVRLILRRWLAPVLADMGEETPAPLMPTVGRIDSARHAQSSERAP